MNVWKILVISFLIYSIVMIICVVCFLQSLVCNLISFIFLTAADFYFVFFSQDRSACYNDCMFSYVRNNQSLIYDFSHLSRVGSLMNGPSFTARGTKFFHFFNISLCGSQVIVYHFLRSELLYLLHAKYEAILSDQT